MTQQLLEQTLGALACEIPGATRVFHAFNLDFCCGGQLSLSEAAKRRGIEAEQVAAIIVGYPLNMDGSAGPRATRTDEFMAELARRTAIPVRQWDERLSTKSAESVLIEAGTRRDKRREVVDKLAAQIMLQNYLDAHGPAPDDPAP